MNSTQMQIHISNWSCQPFHFRFIIQGKEQTNGLDQICYKSVTDWLRLGTYVPQNTKQVIPETFFPANLLAWYWRN